MRAAIILLFVLAACKPQGEPSSDNANARSGITLPNKIGRAAEPDAAPSGLAGYVGKYPDDKVGGVAFKDVPAVKAAVAAVVPDPAIVATVVAFGGPNTPIAQRDGRLLAYGCETHNCGAHNWTIAITPDGKTANVCYKADDATAPRWFGAAPPASDGDSCPSGDE